MQENSQDFRDVDLSVVEQTFRIQRAQHVHDDKIRSPAHETQLQHRQLLLRGGLFATRNL